MRLLSQPLSSTLGFMLNRRVLLLALSSAPLVFIVAGEAVYDFFGGNRTTATAAAVALSLLAAVAITWWHTLTSDNRVLPLVSPRYREAAKRFGLVAGIVCAPVFATAVIQASDWSWSSPVPYLLVTPGLLVFGFLAASTAVRTAFWCIEALHEA